MWRVDTFPVAMRDQQLDLEVGRRAHRLVALALARGVGPGQMIDLAAEVFTTWPTTRAMAQSARLRCVTAAATYLGRCVPVGYQLVGVEEPLGGGVADLIWSSRNGHRMLVDELKTGQPAPVDRDVATQVARLRRGGLDRWPGQFVGVRVVTLGAVRRSWLVRPDGTLESPIADRALEVR